MTKHLLREVLQLSIILGVVMSIIYLSEWLFNTIWVGAGVLFIAMLVGGVWMRVVRERQEEAEMRQAQEELEQLRDIHAKLQIIKRFVDEQNSKG